jgi:hypothetical protein
MNVPEDAVQSFDQLPATQPVQQDGIDDYHAHAQFEAVHWATIQTPVQYEYQLASDQPQGGQGDNYHHAAAYYSDDGHEKE